MRDTVAARRKPGQGRLRAVLGVLHRLLGLATALFLAVAGLTGSLLAFNHELDEWLNPDLFRAGSTGEFLSPADLAARVEVADPRGRVVFMPLAREAGHAVVLTVQPRLDPATTTPFVLDYNQVFADPVTGDILGRRQWGAFKLDRAHLIPFLYVLHYSLHLPGQWGLLLMGSVAIAWTIDCFIGLALILPRGRPFLIEWKAAWTVKRGAGAYRRSLDLHRAGGLWFWGVLLALAVSGVSLSLNEQVFRPIVSLFSTLTPSVREAGMARWRPERPEPRLSFDDALARGEEAAQQRGLTDPAASLLYAPNFGAYGVSIGAEHGTGLGPSWLYFDDETGDLILADMRGEGSAGDIFIQLQFPLHSGQVAGLPGRILISVAGLAVAVLSVTGVVIWWKKRRGRKARRRRRGAHYVQAAE